MAKSLPGLPADLDQRVPALPQPGKQCIGKKEEGPGDIFCRFGVFLRKEPRPENPVDDVASPDLLALTHSNQGPSIRGFPQIRLRFCQTTRASSTIPFPASASA